MVAVVNEAFVRTFWSDIDPIGRRVRPSFGDKTPGSLRLALKDVKQAGVDQPAGTELPLLVDQLPKVFPAMPAASLGRLFGGGSTHFVCELNCRPPRCRPRSRQPWRGRSVAADHSLAPHGGGVPGFDAAPLDADGAPRGVRRPCAPVGGDRYTACCRTWSHNIGVRLGSVWRSAPNAASCSAPS